MLNTDDFFNQVLNNLGNYKAEYGNQYGGNNEPNVLSDFSTDIEQTESFLNRVLGSSNFNVQEGGKRLGKRKLNKYTEGAAKKRSVKKRSVKKRESEIRSN